MSLCSASPRVGSNPIIHLHKKQQPPLISGYCFWRRRWDSNPRARLKANAFRVRPVMTTSIRLHLLLYSKRLLRGNKYFGARPVMSCCGARKICISVDIWFFDRCHSFLLAYSATGSARKRPHFDTSTYIFNSSTLDILAKGHYYVKEFLVIWFD